MNPAAVSYMDLNIVKGSNPILDEITDLEKQVNNIIGYNIDVDEVKSYKWKIYPKCALIEVMGKNATRLLAKALVGHTVWDLLDLIVNKSQGLFGFLNETKVGGNMPVPMSEVEEENDIDNETRNMNVMSGSAGKSSSFTRSSSYRYSDRSGERFEINGKSLIGQMMGPMVRNKSQLVLVV